MRHVVLIAGALAADTDDMTGVDDKRDLQARAAAAAVAVVALVLAWLTYTRDGWIPFLSGVDFGIHELGHLLFMWAPRPVMVFAGSGLQVAVPLGLAAYFWWARSERLAAALMLAWAGASLNNVSVYIYDATRLALPLWGDFDGTAANHDWRYLLGPEVFDALWATDAIAYTVRGASAVLLAAAFAIAMATLVAPWLEARRARMLEAHRAGLPVREPRTVPVRPAPDPAPGDDAADGDSRATLERNG